MDFEATCPNTACATRNVLPEPMSGRPVRCHACGGTFVTSGTGDWTPGATQPHLPAHPDPAASALAVVGRFAVREKLGAGAFGAVYLAYDPQLDRPIALKVPKPGTLDRPQRVERFLREAKAAAKLRHPHIVPVFDAGKDGDHYYIASAFIDGTPLADAIEETGTDFRRAARLARELAEALAYAHKQGIVHRDVKPANAMVDANDQLHLMDFGLASRAEDAGEARLTKDGAVMGTPAYMSPEQARGESGEATPASDQYAVGVVLYELLTGDVPFRGPVANVLHGAIHTEPERPTRRRGDVPADLETICLKAMSKRPADRYPGCQEMADDLRRWLEGEPITARRLSAAERVARWVRKNPAAATAGTLAAAAVVLTAVAVALWGLYQDAERQRGIAVESEAAAQTARAAAEGEREAKEAARLEAVRLKDVIAGIEYGRTIRVALQECRGNNVVGALALLDATDPARRGWEWRYVRSLCDGSLFTLVGQRNHCAAPSPDGTRVVTGHWDTTAVIWDARTGAQLLTLKGHMKAVHTVAFSPDGARVVTASGDKTAKVWDAKTGVELFALNGHTSSVNVAAFSPDGGRIVTGSGDLTAKVWDAKTGAERVTLKGHASYVQLAAFSPDGTQIVTGGPDKMAKLWDARTGAELLTLLHASWVHCASFSPDGTRLVTGADRATVWDARSGAELLTLKGLTPSVQAAAFSPDGARIVTSSGDLLAKVWDAKTGSELVTLKGHTSLIKTALFSADGARVFTGSVDGTAKFWSARTGADDLTLRGHANVVEGASFSPDGTRVVTASRDMTAKVWDAKSGAELVTLKGHSIWLRSASFSPDGSRVVAGGMAPFDERAVSIITDERDKTVKVWDAKTGATLLTLKGHKNMVPHVAFSPDGARIVTGSYDKTARVWDAKTGTELLTLAGHTASLSAVAFSPDGARILTGGRDGVAKVWDAKTGAELLTLEGHNSVTGAAFSRDGGRIVTSGIGAAKVWDAKTGAEVLTLDGSGEDLSSVSFSPDGSRVVAQGNLVTVRMWDTRTGAEVLTLREWRMSAPAFSPDGSRIVSAVDGTAVILDARPFKDRWAEREAAAPLSPPKPTAPVVAHPNRTAAEAVLAVSGGVHVNGQTRLIRLVADLPAGPFQFTGINLHGNRRVTPATFAPLARSQGLTTAWLNNSSVDDTALSYLPLAQLRTLHLHNTAVTDKGLTRFDGITTLTELNIGMTKATGKSLAHFKGAADLTQLLAYHIPLTDDDVALIDGWKRLTLVELHGTAVGDATLARLAACQNLSVLGLEQTKITDAGLAHLHKAKALTSLRIGRNAVTAEAVARLAKALPGCKIERDGGPVESKK